MSEICISPFPSTDPNPLITKLQNVSALSEDDRRALSKACRSTREFAARQDVISEGERPDHVHLILDGWAARYKLIADGARQFTAYLIPGDFCDLHVTILREMDHGILALTPITVAYIAHGELEALTAERPALTRALWWATLVDEAVLRSWIVNIGRRDARTGIAHLMCEMHVRMRNVGLVEEGGFELPLTQEQLADTLGMTPVHANRVLRQLADDGLIAFKSRHLFIPDVAALRAVAGFDDNYLHVGERLRN